MSALVSGSLSLVYKMVRAMCEVPKGYAAIGKISKRAPPSRQIFSAVVTFFCVSFELLFTLLTDDQRTAHLRHVRITLQAAFTTH
jgi:hypothetical protein